MSLIDPKLNKFTGVFSALPTPFYKNEVDYSSLEKLVQHQINNEIDGFVVNGTTAESPTLQWTEVEKIYHSVKKNSGNENKIIIGTGSNSTEQTIRLTQKAQELEADAALVVVPYYNKPPQRGLEQHFIKIADSVKIPIILYNVPGRTITGLSQETILKLSQHENIIGIKEASGDISFDEKIKSIVSNQFLLLSGDDPTYLPFLKLGGHGIISVMSNLLTKACVRWTKLAKQNHFKDAENDFNKYAELIQLMYVEANPIPLKWMLHKVGIFRSAEARLPLMALEEKYFAKIEAQLNALTNDLGLS